jgi:hypothetical protein
MKAPEVSSGVTYRIALVGEATTAAKTHIKPCAVEMATCTFGGQLSEKLVSVQPFDNTVKSSLQDLSADLEKQLVWRLKQLVWRLKQLVWRLKQLVWRLKQLVWRLRQLVWRIKHRFVFSLQLDGHQTCSGLAVLLVLVCSFLRIN